jgi:chromosome segregation ATPase
MEERDIVLNKLDDILKKIINIEARIENLEQDIKYLKDGTNNMNEHISFIENVYDTIKNPFYFVMNKIKPIDNIPDKPKSLTEN